MRLEAPLVLGVAMSASAMWSVTYYTTPHFSDAVKEAGGLQAGCRTLDSGTGSVTVSTDIENNITLSTDSSCNPPYEDAAPSEVTDYCVKACGISLQTHY
ncbi:hypothetical protein N7444_006945 [Penicillium canescens]|nr:hypothetical protein N7444_006945 [Penicillium canescens]